MWHQRVNLVQEPEYGLAACAVVSLLAVPVSRDILQCRKRCRRSCLACGQATNLVPKRGLEPPRGYPHYPLKVACLPISPLRHKLSLLLHPSLQECQNQQDPGSGPQSLTAPLKLVIQSVLKSAESPRGFQDHAQLQTFLWQKMPMQNSYKRMQ